jgi:hypothetical protein
VPSPKTALAGCEKKFSPELIGKEDSSARLSLGPFLLLGDTRKSE